MFDYVRSEIPLPDGFEGELQTKDIGDPYMNLATIRANGRLVYDERPWQELDAETADDLDWHGFLNFYGSEGRHGQPGYRWHEYVAKFTDGQLVEIKLIEERS